jgi:hypothetical protein
MKDATAPRPPLDPTSIAAIAVAGAQIADDVADLPTALPRDHPAWSRDVLAVSARVRAIVAALRPAAVRVLSFWDHAVRSIAVGGRHVEVDPSGCYRVR